MPRTPLRLLVLAASDEIAQRFTAPLAQRGRFEPAWRRAGTREELEQALDAQAWDVAILDPALVGLGSLEAVETLRRRGIDLPLVVVSDALDAQRIEAARRAGIDECASTLDAGGVAQALERALRRAQARRTRRRSEREQTDRIFRMTLESVQGEEGTRPPEPGAPEPPAAGDPYYDTLTGLARRTLLYDRLVQGVAQCLRTGRGLALAFVGLDRFAALNERLGRAAGDQILREVAGMLRDSLRRGDTVARWEGDQFGILLPGIAGPEAAARVASKILEGLRAAPLRWGDQTVQVAASIGLAVHPLDGPDARTLVARASAALRMAKERGRNGYHFHSPTTQARAYERLALEDGLRAAPENGELELYYQPMVHLESGHVAGLEALVRWRHPDMGLILPARFLAIADEMRLTGPIGEWVLRTALAQARPWMSGAEPSRRLAVNVSVGQLRDEGFPRLVSSVLEREGVPPAALELELSEPSLPESDDLARAVGRLKDTGVRVSLDDMGVGRSSLGLLRRLPLDTLKVDCSSLHDSRTGPEFVRLLVALGRALGLRVVAEGVETAEQLELVRAHAPHEVQGHAVEREQRAEEVAASLAPGRPLL